MKTALIVGVSGQDGSYLFEHLESKKYLVFGFDVGHVRTNIEKAPKKGVDVTDFVAVKDLIERLMPDEIYYLAAVHHSSQEAVGRDRDLFAKSWAINVQALIHFLEAIRACAPKARLFYAASSHIFGRPTKSVQDESTPFNPICVYGITKTAGLQVCRYYRGLGVFASVGIMYNHESPRRPDKFVTQKIVKGAIAISRNKQKELLLGDLKAKVDWGSAPDYVEAMHRMLRLKSPDDFVVATGELHSIEDFAKEAFGCLGLDWKKHVKVDGRLIQKQARGQLKGDSRKLREVSGWKPKMGFKAMVRTMVEEGLKSA